MSNFFQYIKKMSTVQPFCQISKKIGNHQYSSRLIKNFDISVKKYGNEYQQYQLNCRGNEEWCMCIDIYTNILII